MNKPRRQLAGQWRQMEADPWVPWDVWPILRLHIGKSQPWRAVWSFPSAAGPGEAATNCGMLVASSKLLRARHGQCVWHWPVPESHPKGPEPTHKEASARQQWSEIQQTLKTAYPKRDCRRHQSLQSGIVFLFCKILNFLLLSFQYIFYFIFHFPFSVSLSLFLFFPFCISYSFTF